MSALLLAFACSGQSTGGDGMTDLVAVDTDDTVDTIDTYETTVPPGTELFGSPPDSPMPPPTFVATNRDGSTRTQADLIGHPTALWFYPAAGTGG